MQAITVKYLRPTNSRGARLKATCTSGSITVGYPHHLRYHETELYAAQELVKKLGWSPSLLDELVGGRLPDGNTTVFCFKSSSLSSNV